MRGWAVAVALVLLTACTAEPDDGDSTPSPADASSEAERGGAPSTPPGEEGDLPPVRHPDTLPTLMRHQWRASRVRVGEVLERTDAYTRYHVTYRSDSLDITGQLLRPHGRGPFPGIVLNHGYIEPSIYTNGQGLAREQDYLARAGFVVLHTDYRGHAGSDPGPGVETRVGYTRDAINAVLALEREPYVAPDRMAMLGRSMGGGVTLNALVAYPDLVEAAVVYASVSSSVGENLRHFVLPNRPDEYRQIIDRFGTAATNPTLYADLSARTFFDRVSDPVLMHHGTADESCPFRWARETHRLLRRAGADVELAVYEGEHHSFVPRWQESIEHTVRFVRGQW